MSDETKTEPIEAEVTDDKQIAKIGQPFTVTDLASSEAGVAIMERKLQIMKTLRAASIALTFPHDWLLFRAEDRVTGYLQDLGCDRVKDMWGIQIHILGDPKDPFSKIEDPDDPSAFGYAISGWGESTVTTQTVEAMTGIRYSDDDFIISRKIKPMRIDAEVRKAARANLDGSILRELAGLKSVPVEELDQIWATTWKKSDKCPRGRGFGTADERAGAASDKHGIDYADIPTCDVCRIKLVYRPAKKFFGCPTYAKHPETKVIVNLDDLLKQIEARKKEKREAGGEG